MAGSKVADAAIRLPCRAHPDQDGGHEHNTHGNGRRANRYGRPAHHAGAAIGHKYRVTTRRLHRLRKCSELQPLELASGPQRLSQESTGSQNQMLMAIIWRRKRKGSEPLYWGNGAAQGLMVEPPQSWPPSEWEARPLLHGTPVATVRSPDPATGRRGKGAASHEKKPVPARGRRRATSPRHALRLVQRFAEGQDFEVAARRGGHALLAELPALRPDVALLDRNMPEVGGLDVLRAINRGRSCQVGRLWAFNGRRPKPSLTGWWMKGSYRSGRMCTT